jgi:hypothetical protein
MTLDPERANRRMGRGRTTSLARAATIAICAVWGTDRRRE